MNFESEHLTTISILRKKINKWRNICILIIFIFVSIILSSFVGPNISTSITKPNTIVKITIEDVILKDSYRDKILENIQNNQNIKAIILKVNSPGGDIVASEELLYKLKKISKNKPIVTSMESVAASGGYLVALASDYILARNGTITGSIGVIMQSGEVTDLANKIGIKFLNYKSSPLKSSPSFFEKENPTAKLAIQEVIDDSHDFFVNIVKKHRKEKIQKENFTKIFDGRIFNGRQAKKMGLIDAIGGDDEAISYLLQKTKIKKPNIINIDLKKKETGLFSNFKIGNIFNWQNYKSAKLMAIYNN